MLPQPEHHRLAAARTHSRHYSLLDLLSNARSAVGYWRNDTNYMGASRRILDVNGVLSLSRFNTRVRIQTSPYADRKSDW